MLLIKTAWGGKSLFVDFRPPTSGGDDGPCYRLMIADIRTALARVKKSFPLRGRRLRTRGIRVVSRLERRLRPEECRARVRAESGEPDPRRAAGIRRAQTARRHRRAHRAVGRAPGEWATLRKAQAPRRRGPEFARTSPSSPPPSSSASPEDSPNPGHGHHEFGNAETYFLVGDASGKRCSDC